MLGFDVSIDRVRLQTTAGMRRRFRRQISTANGTAEGPLQKVIKETIKSLGASSIKDMGKIMGFLKQKYSDNIDFSKANIIIKGLLN